MQRISITGLLFILLVLSGCTNQSTPQGDANTDSANTEASVIPTPSSDEVGAVSGRILNLSEGETEPEPIQVITFYLGDILVSDTGVEGMATLPSPKETAPTAEPDEQGNFTFVDVPTGRYSLWIETVRGPVNLRQPDGENLIIEVSGGDTVELGEMIYEINGL